MVSVTRYDVALLYKSRWGMLNWKGDDHTNGIYFDDQYGYLVERTYAVRVEHNESTTPVFYIPGKDEDSDDEVLVNFPYNKMVKKPNKYHLLFNGTELCKQQLPDLFRMGDEEVFELSIEPLIQLLESVPKKRERDRSWLSISRKNKRVTAKMIQKKKEVYITTKEIEMENECLSISDSANFFVNANNFLHAMSLFSCSRTISFTKTHDRIILTSGKSTLKVEALISLPKQMIQREIEYQIK
jgi:hypothetical protein